MFEVLFFIFIFERAKRAGVGYLFIFFGLGDYYYLEDMVMLNC